MLHHSATNLCSLRRRFMIIKCTEITKKIGRRVAVILLIFLNFFHFIFFFSLLLFNCRRKLHEIINNFQALFSLLKLKTIISKEYDLDSSWVLSTVSGLIHPYLFIKLLYIESRVLWDWRVLELTTIINVDYDYNLKQNFKRMVTFSKNAWMYKIQTHHC